MPVAFGTRSVAAADVDVDYYVEMVDSALLGIEWRHFGNVAIVES